MVDKELEELRKRPIDEGRLWQSVFVRAVRDYRAGKLNRRWFYGRTGLSIARIIIAAGLADDTARRVRGIVGRAAA